MKKYIVLALTLQGLRKKHFEAGEIVTESNFPAGQVPVLIEKGFLEEVKAPQVVEKTKADSKNEVEKTK